MQVKLKQNTKSRLLALENYYKSPNICKHCNSIIYVKPNVTVHETKRKYFCNSSCAGTFNNKGTIKNKRNIDNYCICGNTKKKKNNFCKNCSTYINRTERTIGDIINKNVSYASVKYNRIRELARWFLKLNKIEKTCKLCDHRMFDNVVETCHIKPITSFSNDTKLSIVNSLDNLIYLCPSHHAMLDKGLIKL